MWQCESSARWNGERHGELHAGGNPPIPFALNECRRIPNQWSPESLLTGTVASAVLAHVIEEMYLHHRYCLSAYISSATCRIDHLNGISSLNGITITISATVETARETTELDRTIKECLTTCAVLGALTCPVKIETNITQRPNTKGRMVQYG